MAPGKVKSTITPDLLLTPHSSVLDLVFYDADHFPAAYRGSAFVALKGSWNRSVPTGYKVVRVPFKDGKPEGYYENFATRFWVSGERRAEVGGRPAARRLPPTERCWSRMTLQGRSGASPTLAIANVLIVVDHEVRPSSVSGLTTQSLSNLAWTFAL